MTKIELAKWLHENYEAVAKDKNWNTQENCKVEFDTLPDANKKTMIEIAGRLLNFNLLQLHFVSNCANDVLKEELKQRKRRRTHYPFWIIALLLTLSVCAVQPCTCFQLTKQFIGCIAYTHCCA
jgi:hypothetical protein